jgi:hypothetical protein
VVRGGAAAPLAQLLAAVEPAVAAAAGLPPWSLISAGTSAPVLGRLRFAPTLVRIFVVLEVPGAGAAAWPALCSCDVRKLFSGVWCCGLSCGGGADEDVTTIAQQAQCDWS